MAKILLTITGVLILTLVVIAMHCAMVVAGRSDDRADEDKNKGHNDTLS